MSTGEWMIFFMVIDGPILGLLYMIWWRIGQGFYLDRDEYIKEK